MAQWHTTTKRWAFALRGAARRFVSGLLGCLRRSSAFMSFTLRGLDRAGLLQLVVGLARHLRDPLHLRPHHRDDVLELAAALRRVPLLERERHRVQLADERQEVADRRAQRVVAALV